MLAFKQLKNSENFNIFLLSLTIILQIQFYLEHFTSLANYMTLPQIIFHLINNSIQPHDTVFQNIISALHVIWPQKRMISSPVMTINTSLHVISFAFDPHTTLIIIYLHLSTHPAIVKGLNK